MVNLFEQKDHCCGCTACDRICPKSAIDMKEDSEGFLYPIISVEKCVECNLCKKVCAFQNGYNCENNFDSPIVYAVKHKDENVRMTSSSGGVFAAISQYVIEHNGVVYGVMLESDMNVIHEKAETKEEMEKFKGSKYVQSELRQTFDRVKEDLKQDKIVLFTGTPCQVGGLKGYLKNVNTNKLITCDLICHGVPSNKVFQDYINSLSQRYKSKIKSFTFRNKKYGWRGISATFENFKSYKGETNEDNFYRLFYGHYILRPSCHNCKYTNLNRVSDFTLADFWGIENYHPEFYDKKGVSLLLINTEKGEEVFKEITNIIDYLESKIENCLQPQLQYPSKPATNRTEFWKDYHENDYEYIVKKYLTMSFSRKVKNIILRLLKQFDLLPIITKILGRG